LGPWQFVFLDGGGKENEPTGPSNAANPVCADEGGGFIGSEFGVLGDLDEGGGGPDEDEKEGGEEEVAPIAEVEAGGAGGGFEEHEGGDDVGHLLHVASVVAVEGFAFESGEERIDGDLDNPDDACHRGAGDELDQEEGGEHGGMI